MIEIVLLILIICYYAYEYYCSYNDPTIKKIRNSLLQLHPITQNIHIYKSTKSYCLNKREIYLCTEDKNGNEYSFNTLIYVAIHELAHCIDHEVSDEHEHTFTFNLIFNDLLHKAAKLNIYNPKLPIPIDYGK